SNLGAFLTPVGALAGIMFSHIVKTQNVKLSFARFTLYGTVIALPTLASALLGLYIIL
ncbi:MAG: arsenical efflux pump membrane protein ArsB, partial [Clostridia bacterium]|nr:arsenical efflux pump membrane protein ArsB [Clostridia bacterium]